MDPIVPILGQHCSLQSCNLNDFLPFNCSACSLPFCQLHSNPSNHNCTNDPNIANILTQQQLGNRFEQKFKDLLPDPNRRVDLTQGERDRLAKREAAKAVLEKNFGKKVKVESPTGEKKKETKVVSPVIQLMKLKQRAKQGDPRKSAGDVPMDQRLYFTVVYLKGLEKEEKGSEELWLPKTTTTGKTLDLCADHFGIENVNNISQDPSKLLSLVLPSSSTPIPSGLSLDSILSNGTTIHLLLGSFPS